MAEINLSDHTVIINGHHCQGWADGGDALVLPQEFEAITTKVGADGHVTAMRTGMKGGEIVLSFMPDTPSSKRFFRWMEEVRSGIAIRFDGSVTNNKRQYSASLRNGTLTKGSLFYQLGGSEVTNPKFTFYFETISIDFDAADFTLQVPSA